MSVIMHLSPALHQEVTSQLDIGNALVFLQCIYDVIKQLELVQWMAARMICKCLVFMVFRTGTHI